MYLCAIVIGTDQAVNLRSLIDVWIIAPHINAHKLKPIRHFISINEQPY